MNQIVFDKCSEINQFLVNNNEGEARDRLIQLLDYMQQNNISHCPLVNSLIREVGLYPYMDVNTSEWQDAFVYELFKEDIGEKEEKVLHREQFRLLSLLLTGKNIAVSAPTSFGKSFIVDAFIKLKKPNNVVIIVPTIALMDEIRRRIYKKFSNEYNIITTTESTLKEKNIFIFPQERALAFVNRINVIDILIIDEFYKSSKYFDKERSPVLIKAIIKLGRIAKQKYYLAPNITKIEFNQFTRDMEFIKINFNTVYLNVIDLYPKVKNDLAKKKECFLSLSRELNGKTLVYAGSYSNISILSDLVINHFNENNSSILINFSKWLSENYDDSFDLALLVRRGVGIHNGALHRFLSQIQIKLFDESDGLNRLISTSSIIEGVNTSAENVIVWVTSGRGLSFNRFSYKNLIGRAGRMFRYFVGNIYLLARQPEESETELQIPFPEEILGSLDRENDCELLTKDQMNKIDEYDKEMLLLMGEEYKSVKAQMSFKSQDANFIRKIAYELKFNSEDWACLRDLNSNVSSLWKDPLYIIIKLQPGLCEGKFLTYIKFVRILSNNWTRTIPELLVDLNEIGVSLNDFFRWERSVVFKLSALISDINVLQKLIWKSDLDLSSFVGKLSSAFLPPVVYQLEEYGLPRMIARKIQKSRIINFEDPRASLQAIISTLQNIDHKTLKESSGFDVFDSYIYDYFLDGITC